MQEAVNKEELKFQLNEIDNFFEEFRSAAGDYHHFSGMPENSDPGLNKIKARAKLAGLFSVLKDFEKFLK